MLQKTTLTKNIKGNFPTSQGQPGKQIYNLRHFKLGEGAKGAKKTAKHFKIKNIKRSY